MIKKFLSLALGVGLSLGMLTSCAGRDNADTNTANTSQETSAEAEGKTNLTFWHSMGGAPGDAVNTLVDRYNQSQDEVFVTSEYQGEYDDALTKLRSAASGEDVGADLVQVFELGTRYMIDSGLIRPMQEFVDADGYDLSQLEENLLAYYTVDGTLNSMPFNSSTPLLYYNKEMFDEAGVEPPKSLEEMKEVGQKLLDSGVTDMPISMNVYGWWIDQYMNKQGLDLFDNENGRQANPTQTVFTENGGVLNILEAWKELEEMGIAPNVGKQGGGPEFLSGTSAMTVASTANLAQYLKEVGDRFTLETAYFPAVADSDEGGVSIGGASVYILDSGNEEKMNAAWDFVKFLVNPESQAYWNASTGYFPVNKGAHEEEEFKKNIEQYPQFKTAIDQLHDSAPEDQGALATVYQEARQVMEKYIEEMLNGDKTPKEAEEAMAEEIDAALESYNKVN